ncbi:MAG TPA: hypothetical protein VNH13_07545 [Candidatus Acidoferrales bacterium]|nr:hypothetical protein [Candidatus Acidoferrales bacterium]
MALLAMPSEEMKRGIKDGQSVAMPMVGWAHSASGRFEVRVDTERIPAGYVSENGQLNLELVAWVDRAGGRTFFSSQLGSSSRSAIARSARAVEVPDLEVATAGTAIPVTDTPDITCDRTKQSTYFVRTQIGETHPFHSYTTAWMELGSSHSETVGSATSLGTVWSQSGTLTTTTGFSKTWNPANTSKGYDMEEQYGKWWNSCTLEYEFFVDYATGGNYSYSISWTAWTHCTHVDAGLWARERSDGYAYSLSLGVKSQSIIAIGLSLSTQYNTSGSLARRTVYNVGGTGTQMCGSNTTPATAARISDGG